MSGRKLKKMVLRKAAPRAGLIKKLVQIKQEKGGVVYGNRWIDPQKDKKEAPRAKADAAVSREIEKHKKTRSMLDESRQKFFDLKKGKFVGAGNKRVEGDSGKLPFDTQFTEYDPEGNKYNPKSFDKGADAGEASKALSEKLENGEQLIDDGCGGCFAGCGGCQTDKQIDAMMADTSVMAVADRTDGVSGVWNDLKARASALLSQFSDTSYEPKRRNKTDIEGGVGQTADPEKYKHKLVDASGKAEEGEALDENTKTWWSVDFTNVCPRLLAGKPCEYCYVENGRTGKHGTKGPQMKPEFIRNKYNHEILDWATREKGGMIPDPKDPTKKIKVGGKDTIAQLNAMGGLRLFNASDYQRKEQHKMVKMFLDDCADVGLKVKVITKQPGFIHDFHDHPAINVINVSIDNTGDGVDWWRARRLRAKHEKVRVRCMARNPEEALAFGGLDWVDVVTAYHANAFEAKRMAKYGYVNMLYLKKGQEFGYLAEAMPKKMCCGTGHCSGCKAKCGAPERVDAYMPKEEQNRLLDPIAARKKKSQEAAAAKKETPEYKAKQREKRKLYTQKKKEQLKAVGKAFSEVIKSFGFFEQKANPAMIRMAIDNADHDLFSDIGAEYYKGFRRKSLGLKDYNKPVSCYLTCDVQGTDHFGKLIMCRMPDKTYTVITGSVKGNDFAISKVAENLKVQEVPAKIRALVGQTTKKADEEA